MKLVVAFILVTVMLINIPDGKAQISLGNGLSYTPITGTGGVIGIEIPNSGGQTINVGTGSAALPLRNIHTDPAATTFNLGDDSMRNVPIGFTFPYWGQNFTNSWMSSNGFVSFAGNIPGAGCCSGRDLRTLRDPTYNYMIAPLWTDLIHTTGTTTATIGDSTSRTYGWYNTAEYSNRNNRSSFEININSSGLFDVRFGSAFVSNQVVTSGITGDLSQGQYWQFYHGTGFNIPANNPISYGTTGVVNLCTSNPLSDPSCPGYTAAYTIQQCTISALYDPSCPGYQQAYFNQQCTADALYNSSCPGYTNAYTTQQCLINPLYSTTCTGYQQAYLDQQCNLNSLYSINCPGYAAAYFTQQCNASALFSPNCPGYAAAYLDQQCTISSLYSPSCPGYSVAYKAQQCSISALYATDCPGYQQAYLTQQCTISSLYSSSCPGYAAAYFTQQCTLNGLYDRTCPNYSTAYATKTLLDQQSTPVVVSASVSTPAVNTISDSGVVTTTPSSTGNSTVDNILAPASTTSVSPAAINSVAAPPPPPPSAPNSPLAVAATKQDSPVASSNNSQPEQKTENTKPQSKREEIVQSRREAAQKDAVEAGKNLAKTVGEAKSMEDVTKNQGLVVAAMGYVAGFNAYNIQLQDNKQFYKPYQIYGNQRNVDNRTVLRGLSNDGKYNEMIQSQYK